MFCMCVCVCVCVCVYFTHADVMFMQGLSSSSLQQQKMCVSAVPSSDMVVLLQVSWVELVFSWSWSVTFVEDIWDNLLCGLIFWFETFFFFFLEISINKLN